MSTSFADIKKYYNACRPDEPIEPSDPRWVDLSPLRGSGRDIVSQLLRQIDLEAQFTTLLVTGFRGTGKTSLLKACHQKLEQSSYHVIYTDIEADYLMNPHEEINANDILNSLRWLLSRRREFRIVLNLSSPHYDERIRGIHEHLLC